MLDIRRKFVTGLLIAGIAASACLAQDGTTEKPDPKFYKLQFVVKEVEGNKVLNARTYSTLVSTDSNNSIRSGEKIPIALPLGATQLFDVGTNLDCQHVRPIQNELSLNVTVETSGLSQESAAEPTQPAVRNYRWTAGVLIPLNKPTVIFSSDHAIGKGQMQVELTATPIQ